MMRVIPAAKIKDAAASLCLQANFVLRPDVLAALKSALKKENKRQAREILQAIIANAAVAAKERVAICQDTGLPCVFIELGQDVRIKGNLKKAVIAGVKAGYQKGCLRNSIVRNPLQRKEPGFSPALTHFEIAQGNKLKLTILPKGFGCENKTRLKMFHPTSSLSEIKQFILEAVRQAGPDACPPYVVGVGIGGSADYACYLAKKALLRKINPHPRKSANPQSKKLETELLTEINRLNLGPMGLGGKTTALAVNVETHPTHIAGLPVCVNISCHALRSAMKIL